MAVPILKQGNVLIACIQAALSDNDLRQLKDDLADRVGRFRSAGVVIDVSALDVMDSFATRTLRVIAETTKLRGARTVVVGIQPDVAMAMIQLGLTLDGVATGLDLDEGLELVSRHAGEPDDRIPLTARKLASTTTATWSPHARKAASSQPASASAAVI